MRTTVTLDDDVAALIENERTRTGESFRTTINRLLRRSSRTDSPVTSPPLPALEGRPMLDISDVSALLATLDDARGAERDLP